MKNEDELVMYLIVKRSLNMSAGKVGAQCGHAVEQLLVEYFTSRGSDETQKIRLEETMWNWLYTSRVKVVLGASDVEWDALTKMVEDLTVLGTVVVDEGRTEVAPNSKTVIGLWPRRRGSCQPLIAQLRPL